MTAHDLLFYENRSTAEVVPRGAKGKPKSAKAGFGKQIRRRPATPDEERKIARGEWVRTRQSGKDPNDPGSKKSRIRPALAKKQKIAALLRSAKNRSAKNKP